MNCSLWTCSESLMPYNIQLINNYKFLLWPLLWPAFLLFLLSPAAAAAKSLQSCLTLCDPIDGSPPGSPVPRILQARTMEWVAISFFNAWKWKVKVKLLSRLRLFVTPWTAAYQAPPSMGFSRQEYWSGVLLPSPSCLQLKQKAKRCPKVKSLTEQTAKWCPETKSQMTIPQEDGKEMPRSQKPNGINSPNVSSQSHYTCDLAELVIVAFFSSSVVSSNFFLVSWKEVTLLFPLSEPSR